MRPGVLDAGGNLFRHYWVGGSMGFGSYGRGARRHRCLWEAETGQGLLQGAIPGVAVDLRAPEVLLRPATASRRRIDPGGFS